MFTRYGHTVKLIAPKFVTPYRMTGKRSKNDAADAAAICEAVQRPTMLFVPPKTIDQQQQLTLHRVRQGFVRTRTANLNRVRGLLCKFGIVMPLQADTVKRETREHLEQLSPLARAALEDLLDEINRLDARVDEYDKQLRRLANVKDSPANRLTRLTLAHAQRRSDPISRWALQLEARSGYWRAVVAAAAKIARMAWAVLNRDDQFKLPAEANPKQTKQHPITVTHRVDE